MHSLGSWNGEIGIALIDSVFSIRARYNATNPAKGVSGRVRQFRDLYPEVRDNLKELERLGEPPIREIMGNTVTGNRPKSVAVFEATQAFLNLEPPVITAQDALNADPKTLQNAYTSIPGLDPVTAE